MGGSVNHLLVVGGYSRLAKSTLDHFASLGFVISSIDIQSPKEVRPKVKDFTADISSLDTCVPVLRRVIEESGPVSSVVFFSRHRFRGGAAEDRADWQGSVDVELRAPSVILHELIGLSENKSELRSSVLIGSVLGRLVSLNQTASYHTTKTATEGLVRYLATKFLADGVRVNAIAPGFISDKRPQLSEKDQKITTALPSAVISLVPVVTSQNLASACFFLCSENSMGINGQTIVVDGGWSNIEQLGLLLDYKGQDK